MALQKKKKQHPIVTQYVRMWPREVFDRVATIEEGAHRQLLVKGLDVLSNPGVYILYRDDEPYYIGKTKDGMWHRIWAHANQPGKRLYLFWNFFSAFVINDPKLRTAVEGILIAAMPTANSANPKLPKERMPQPVRDLLREMRRNRVMPAREKVVGD